MPEERLTAERVVEYWDAFLRHEHQAAPEIGRDLATAIQRVHALAAAPPAGSRDRVWRAMQRELEMGPPEHNAPRREPIVGEPINLPALAAMNAKPRERGAWLGRLPGTVATAALVLLTLIGSLIVLGSGRFNRQQAIPVILPAVVATPHPPPTAEIAELVWETRGGPNLPLGLPGQLALDPDGNLWIPDTTHDRFQIFSPGGEFIETWGVTGGGEGEFEFDTNMYPGGAVAFAPDGSFYVVDTGNRRVQKFAPDRSFVTAWGGEGTGPGLFKWPSHAAVDAQGRVYVSDDGRNDIQVFAPDGSFLRTIGEYGFGDGQFFFSSGSSVYAAADGAIWVSDGANHRIQVFTAEGELLSVLREDPHTEQLGQPGQIAIDAAGRVFAIVGDRQQMQVFAPDGAFLGALGTEDAGAWGKIEQDPYTFLFPVGLVLDGEGNVYISDNERERVAKFRLLPPLAPASESESTLQVDEAEPVAELTWETVGGADDRLRFPGRLALDPQGNLWVPDSTRGRFQILSPDAELLEVWGAAGRGEGEFTFETNFYPGGAIAFAADGSFYVADTGNQRIQKFGPDRSFILAWGGEGAGPGTFEWPSDVAVDADGLVYVTDDKRSTVQVFTADGEYVRSIGEFGFGDGQFMFSSGSSIHVDATGTIWVSEMTNRRVQAFSSEGELLFVLRKGPQGQSLGMPGQIAVDRLGRIFVVLNDRRQVQIFAPDGTLLGTLGNKKGSEGATAEQDSHTFLSPIGLVLDDQGNLYVSDHERESISRFRLLPPFAP